MKIVVALYGFGPYVQLEIMHNAKEAQELVENAASYLGIPSGFIGYELTFYQKDKPIHSRNYIKNDTDGSFYWDERSCKYNTHITSWETFKKIYKKLNKRK